MTKQEWLEEAKANKSALVEFVANFHPSNRLGVPEAEITAANAQAACDVVCSMIVAEGKEVEPVKQLEAAIESGDVSKIMSLLNSAWFGTPETTECWQYTGFREAVSLLEDPPKDEEN